MKVMIQICNVRSQIDGKKIITPFDMEVDDIADSNVKLEWWEWTTKPYDAVPVARIWEELFACHRSDSSMFEDAGMAIDDWEEEGPKISFTIHDEPSITIKNEEETNSRRLDFILIMQCTEERIYAAACRQEIEVDEIKKEVKKIEFLTSGFVCMPSDDIENIRGKMQEDTVLDQIIEEYERLKMEAILTV